ncbi:MAG: biopolymer transporter ExbD [Porticoccaceae bacterium]
MAFGDGIGQSQRSSADINIVPLVDVILVLLVIFIVTAPLITQAVKVDLPDAESQPAEPLEKPVVVTIEADGRLHWAGSPLTLAELEQRARGLAARPGAELHIEADRAVAYDAVAQVLAAAARAGVERIGFVTDPGMGATRQHPPPGP